MKIGQHPRFPAVTVSVVRDRTKNQSDWRIGYRAPLGKNIVQHFAFSSALLGARFRESQWGRIHLGKEPLPVFRIKLLKMRILKALFISRKPLETESLAAVYFVIDSCRLVNQSNYLNWF